MIHVNRCRVRWFFEQATPGQITEVVKNMAENDLTVFYANGLVDCAYISGLIAQVQSEHYDNQLKGDRRRSKAKSLLKLIKL